MGLIIGGPCPAVDADRLTDDDNDDEQLVIVQRVGVR